MKPIKSFLRQWITGRRARAISYENALGRVRRGAEYLDEVDAGWYRRVDADTLELSNGQSCVLGQLHGEFRMGLSRARLLDFSSAPRANQSPVDFGFQCVGGVDGMLQEQDYVYLNRAWQAVIRERQADDVPAGITSETTGDPVPAVL